MKADLSAPADTSSMGIVHEALRRDLRRTRATLAGPPYPDDAQRIAIAEHLDWMMRFLHEHHEGEDTALYPLVRAKNPEAAELLDRMDADHQGILPAMATLTAAAEAYRRSGGALADVVAAVEALEQVLLPHLRREEDEMMPVVSATLTEGEWRHWDETTNVARHSKVELADIGHWIIDGQTPEGRAAITHIVPPVQRFVLVHGFAGRYRRASFRRWRSEEFSSRGLPFAGLPHRGRTGLS